LLVEETMKVRHVILTKRETHVGAGREIARAQNEKTQKKKSMDICRHFDFDYN
jgi:hypothetical protein